MGTVHPRKFTCHPEKRTISKGSCIFQPWTFRPTCSVFRRVSNEIPVKDRIPHIIPGLEGSTANKSCKHLGIITGNCASLRRKSSSCQPNSPSAKKMGEIAIVFVKKINGKHKSPCPGKKKSNTSALLCACSSLYIPLTYVASSNFFATWVAVLTLLLSWKTFCLTFPTGHHIQCRFEGQHLPDGRNAWDLGRVGLSNSERSWNKISPDRFFKDLKDYKPPIIEIWCICVLFPQLLLYPELVTSMNPSHTHTTPHQTKLHSSKERIIKQLWRPYRYYMHLNAISKTHTEPRAPTSAQVTTYPVSPLATRAPRLRRRPQPRPSVAAPSRHRLRPGPVNHK